MCTVTVALFASLHDLDFRLFGLLLAGGLSAYVRLDPDARSEARL